MREALGGVSHSSNEEVTWAVSIAARSRGQPLGVRRIDGCQVVYIGKAKNLKERLRAYAKFGTGKAIGLA